MIWSPLWPRPIPPSARQAATTETSLRPTRDGRRLIHTRLHVAHLHRVLAERLVLDLDTRPRVSVSPDTLRRHVERRIAEQRQTMGATSDRRHGHSHGGGEAA